MEYTTSDGTVLKLNAVSPIKIQKVILAVEKQFEKVELPQYCEELPNGKQQCFVHDEVSIEQTENKEEKAQWQAYQEYQAKLNTEKAERSTALILNSGVELESIPTDWIAEQEWLGIKIPENEFDYKVHYITTELLKNMHDFQQVIILVRELGIKGVDDDAITAASRSFRDSQEN